jgi:hypothetical protein
MVKRISIILFCLYIISCNKDASTQSPTSNITINPPNLISNGSFEFNGNPTMEGWDILPATDTSERHPIRFSNDVPPNGGKWSIEFDSLSSSRLFLGTSVNIPQINNKYKLSFWAKTQGIGAEVDLMVTRRGIVDIWKGIVVTSSGWSEYSIIKEKMEPLSQQIPDTMGIFNIYFMIEYSPYIYGKTNIDLVRLEQTD